MPPSVLMPGNVLFEQCMSSPARQARHRPHVGVGWRMTVSPGCTLVTPAPISRTHPAFSCPSVYGKRDVGLLRPLALDDVQVGAAQSGAADLDDHIERTGDAGIRDVLEHRLLAGRRGAGWPSSTHLHASTLLGSLHFGHVPHHSPPE